jgi:hypothetical protein
MPEILTKLRPDRDLQCYFERPSAIAALSAASASGFTVSGCWRQQFDWAVVEWNRDNVFEHPVFRNLPDGDLSGLRLSYRERRTNSMPIDSDIFPTVDWPSLRVWAETEIDGATREVPYKVPLLPHATPVDGAWQCASAEFELAGTVRAADYVGLAWLGEHHTHFVYYDDTLESIVAAIAASVNSSSSTMMAKQSGAKITLTYVGGPGVAEDASRTGANGNRIGVYSQASAGSTLAWDKAWALMSGGTSPSEWRIDLDFSSLADPEKGPVPTAKVRKLRWTWSAPPQPAAFERSEFEVRITEWTVTGTGLNYKVAGPGSRRIEDGDPAVNYQGTWAAGTGNFSGSSIHSTDQAGSSLSISYLSQQKHSLYLGTRYFSNAPKAGIQVDAGAVRPLSLWIDGEDQLGRILLGEFEPGPHTVTLTHAGKDGEVLYFDFLELALPVETLPEFSPDNRYTLATDWDTDHSIALAPERAAWQIHALGFTGRANHYTGAMWFYELRRKGHNYASIAIQFNGTPVMSLVTQISVGRDNVVDTVLQHLNLAGDTAESIAKAFELEINRGYTGIRATAEGSQLTIFARAMGEVGNHLFATATPSEGSFTLTPASASFSGGQDGTWVTDLTAAPRLNRAVRDWSRAYFVAMKAYAIDVTAAFSMELQHGDDSVEVGIAQRYPDGAAAWLNTPALQTNFSPASTAFWRDVYNDMARIMADAGCRPFLQFGEVQWWYFPNSAGMPFYDEYAKFRFRVRYGREMATIQGNRESPALYADELALLSQLIGEFTSEIMGYVHSTRPDCRFEVLYPPDVNDTPLNQLVNYPRAHWTPSVLDCLKTENFTYTYERNLDKCRDSIRYGEPLGFGPQKSSHLVGISDPVSPWQKEVSLAVSENVESVVLFAFDQFCLMGYPVPLPQSWRRSAKMG